MFPGIGTPDLLIRRFAFGLYDDPKEPTEDEDVFVGEPLACAHEILQQPKITWKDRISETLFVIDESMPKLSASEKEHVRLYRTDLLRWGQERLSKDSEINVAEEVNRELAELAFLISHHSGKIESVLAGGNRIRDLSETIFDSLRQLVQRAREHGRLHRAYGLQASSEAEHLYFAREATSALFTNEGLYNPYLIRALRRAIESTPATHRTFHTYVDQQLARIESSPLFHQMIYDAKAPQDDEDLGNPIIRSCLSLPLSHRITDEDAAKTIVFATLCQLDCDASWSNRLCNLFLRLHPGRSADDLRTLLETDTLSRKIHWKATCFDYTLELPDPALKQPILLGRTGKLPAKDRYIYESPGFVAAGLQMGIERDELKALTLQALQQLIPKGIQTRLTVWEIIEAIAELAFEPSFVNDMAYHGRFGFSAETHHPLLGLWACGIGEMTKKQPGGLQKQAVMRAAKLALMRPLRPKHICESSALTKLSSELFEDLHASMRIRSKNQVNRLYASDGIPLDQPKRFETFVGDVLESTAKKLGDDPTLPVIVERVRTSIQTEFSSLLLRHYDYELLRFKSDPLEKWEQLENTPWHDAFGSGKQLLPAFFELGPDAEPICCQPADAAELFAEIVSFLRSQEHEDRLYVCANTFDAFMLHLEHPSLSPAVKSEGALEAWTHKHLIEPIKRIQSDPLPEFSQLQLLNYCKKRLLTEDQHAVFQQKASKLEKNLTICQFHSALLTILRSIDPKNQAAKEWMLERHLIRKALPLDLQMQLCDTAVHFADTNWVESKDGFINRLHFCLYYNPVNNRIEIGTIHEDGSDLSPLNQSDWVNRQPWEFYRTNVVL